MLVKIWCLKRVKLPEQADAHQETTMLVLRLLRFVVHDPVAGLVKTKLAGGRFNELGLQGAFTGSLATLEAGLGDS